MRELSYAVKHYSSAKQRFLAKIIMQFFAREFPRFFGPLMREKLAQDLLTIFEEHSVDPSRLRPGQLLWMALDIHTRGNSPKRRFVPVILSLVTEEDIEELEKGASVPDVRKKVIARIMREAFEQGGLLSTRDVALLLHRNDSYVSILRSHYERSHQTVLPHTGTLHDMGSCISHKNMILTKIILEKKDPVVTARESHHSQAAVDRYLKDYYRVRTVYEHNQDPAYIHQVTGIARHVVKQYITIVQQEQAQS